MKYLVFIIALFSIFSGGHTLQAMTCDADPHLSYYQAVDTYADGSLVIDFDPDVDAHTVTATITNNTECSVPLSLASYKMFGPFDPAHLSEQEFFDGSATITVAASSTETLTVDIPECKTQYDVWYGDVQRVLVDNHVYGEFIAGDNTTVHPHDYCTHPDNPPEPPTPATSTLYVIKHVINDDGGMASSSDFTLHLTLSDSDVAGSPFAGMESPGMSFIVATGTYTVSEDAVAGYAANFSGDCDSSGSISLLSGDTKTCTITNDDIATTTPDDGGSGTTTPPVTPPEDEGGTGGCGDACEDEDRNGGGRRSTLISRSPDSSSDTDIGIPQVLGAADTQFPDAGFGPDDRRGFPWEVILAAGMLMLAIISGKKAYVYVAQKN